MTACILIILHFPPSVTHIRIPAERFYLVQMLLRGEGGELKHLQTKTKTKKEKRIPVSNLSFTVYHLREHLVKMFV